MSKGRDETPEERADRNYDELLQELRVVQTGVQILLAFLLTVAFTPVFLASSVFTQRVFLAVLVLTAVASALLMAPVAIHRLVFRRRLKVDLVSVASRLATGGLACVALAICGAALLAADQVLRRQGALWVAAGCMAVFLVLWVAVPIWLRARGRQGVDSLD